MDIHLERNAYLRILLRSSNQTISRHQNKIATPVGQKEKTKANARLRNFSFFVVFVLFLSLTTITSGHAPDFQRSLPKRSHKLSR